METQAPTQVEITKLEPISPAEKRIAQLQKREQRALAEQVLSPDELTEVLGWAERDRQSEILLGRAGDNIRKYTTAMKVTDEINELSHKEGITGKPVREAVHEEWDTHVKGAGEYHPGTRRIGIQYVRPPRKYDLESLAYEGRLTFPRIVSSHERLHALQDHMKERPPVELQEAQAYRAEPHAFNERLTEDIVNNPIYASLDKTQFRSAFRLVEQLNALGFSVEQVLYIIQDPGTWNEARNGWTNVLNTIEGTMQTLGIDEQELGKLVEAYELEGKVARLEARNITHHVLYDEYRMAIDARRSPLDETPPAGIKELEPV